MGEGRVTSLEVAEYVASEPLSRAQDIRAEVKRFAAGRLEFETLQERLVEEIYWLLVACGAIAVRVVWQDEGVCQKVVGHLIDIYTGFHEASGGETPFTPNYVVRMARRVSLYIARFSQDMYSTPALAKRPVARFDAAMAGLAHQARLSVIGRPMVIKGGSDMGRRSEAIELEAFLFKLISRFTVHFMEHFRGLKKESVLKISRQPLEEVAKEES